MDLIKIGKIVNAQGLKGEVKLISYSDDPDRFEYLENIVVRGKDGPEESFVIEDVRYTSGGSVILKLAGVEDRTAAESMKEKDVFMDEADLPELEEGQYYVRDIAGSEVVAEDGRVIGTLKDVLTNTAQDLYVVERGNGASDLMIPGVDEFILDVDAKGKKITVRLPEGLEEL